MSYNNSINPHQIEKFLNTEYFGRIIFYRENVGSTNDLAREEALKGVSEGAVAIADTQDKSRGRMDREWVSPFGGLWFSLVLRPPILAPQPLTLIFGGAVSEAIEKETGLKCGFHWINDIYMDGKKLGGILLESKFQGEKLDYVIAGIGINGNFPAEVLGTRFVWPPTTLMDQLRKPVDLNRLLARILKQLESAYHHFVEKGPEGLVDHYKNRCVTLGRRVFISEQERKEAYEARAFDLDPLGGLMVELPDGNAKVIYNARRVSLAL